MKKARQRKTEMRREYDFSTARRGKYAKRYREGGNIVMLDPDVSKAFPDSESVNQVLRAIAKVIQSPRKRRATRAN